MMMQRLVALPRRFPSHTVRVGLVAVLITGWITASAPVPVEAGGPHWCECVEYVKSYFGLHGAAGNAKDMGPFLSAHGFRRTDDPVVGGVIILQPGYYKSGSGAIYGHSAVIESIAPAGKSGWFVGIRSGNQTGKQFSDRGCSNVTFKSIGPIPNGSKLASYWLPPRH